jgi:hypothetical protein
MGLNMTLKQFLLSQNVKFPEKKEIYQDPVQGAIYNTSNNAYNKALDELLSIKLPEQRRGLSVEEIVSIITDYSIFCEGDYKVESYNFKHLATAIHNAQQERNRNV